MSLRSYRSHIPVYVIDILKELKAHGRQAYLVGGGPRDLLLGGSPADWDIATDALPEEVEAFFPYTRPTGKRYGTITVRTGDEEAEVTTFRGEGPYSDGRHPDWVTFSRSIKEDLSRRDFTINAIAYDPLAEKWEDPFGGRRDLRKRIVRAVSDPAARFREDGLRMVRFYRFQSKLDFKADRRTSKAINPEWLSGVSLERVREELTKLILGEAPGRALFGLAESGLLAAFAPEIAAMDGVQQGSFHQYDALRHSITAVEAIRPELSLRLAALLHDLGKPLCRNEDERGIHFYGHEDCGAEMAEILLKRLTYPHEIAGEVTALIRHHMANFSAEVTDAGLRRLVARVGREYIPNLIELRRADIIATGSRYDRAWEGFREGKERLEALLAGETVFNVRDLAVNGRDLQEIFGWPPGKKIGRMLDLALQWVLEQSERNTRDQVLEFLREQGDGEDK